MLSRQKEVSCVSLGKGSSADVVELVDTPDLGSGDFGCGGSSPFVRTTLKSFLNLKFANGQSGECV